MNKRLFFVMLTLIVTASMVLSACAPAATEAPVVTEAPPPTEAPTATEPPAPAVQAAVFSPPRMVLKDIQSKCCSSPLWMRTSS